MLCIGGFEPHQPPVSRTQYPCGFQADVGALIKPLGVILEAFLFLLDHLSHHWTHLELNVSIESWK